MRVVCVYLCMYKNQTHSQLDVETKSQLLFSRALADIFIFSVPPPPPAPGASVLLDAEKLLLRNTSVSSS